MQAHIPDETAEYTYTELQDLLHNILTEAKYLGSKLPKHFQHKYSKFCIYKLEEKYLKEYFITSTKKIPQPLYLAISTKLLTIHSCGKLSHHGPEFSLLALSHLQHKNIVPLIIQQGQITA